MARLRTMVEVPLRQHQPAAATRLLDAAPAEFYTLAGAALPWCVLAAVLLAGGGLYVALRVAPTDPVYGEGHRIAYIHFPAVWASLVLYAAMAASAALAWLRDRRLAAMVATGIAPTGAMMSFLALWTGSLWGRLIWGSWWIWDAWLTTELLLLVLYLGCIGVHAAIDDAQRADRAASILALIGIAVLPLAYVPVAWLAGWNPEITPGLVRAKLDSAASLVATLLMLAALVAYGVAAVLARLRSIILERDRDDEWTRRVLGAER
jgi:heme exporter protein C